MSEDGPDVGTVIAAIFLILFGGCVTLVGGACTVLWVGLMASEPGSMDGMGILMLLLSLLVLGGGIFGVVLGIKLLTRKRES